MRNGMKIATFGTMAALMLVPSLTFANTRGDRNEWNNLAIGAAALGVIGALSHNSTLAAVGVGGAAYSVYRADTVRGYDCHRPRFDRDHVRFDSRPGWRR